MKNYFQGHAVRAGAIGALVATVVLLASLIPILGCFIGLLAWVVYVGTGVLAAHWGKAGGTYTIQQSGIDGAVAGGIAGAVSHIVKFLAQIILTTVFHVALSDNLGREVGRVGIAIGAECISAILGIVFAIVLAAVGALLYTAITQQQNKSSAT